MTSKPLGTQPPAATAELTIGELARRTGIAAHTLRMWETRYGFPVPLRRPSGHRRYDESVVDLVRLVARRREMGVSLSTAIADVNARVSVGPPSLFAGMRRLHPHLPVRRLRKRTLTAVCHAMEDESQSLADHPLLIGAFQDASYYQGSEQRWREFARTARGAWVLANFDDVQTAGEPVQVHLPARSPMLGEWSLVVLADEVPLCLAAWELPGQTGVRDDERLFEAVWSLDPVVVLDAARLMETVMLELDVDVSVLTHVLDRPGYLPPGDLVHASSVFTRVVAYIDRSYA